MPVVHGPPVIDIYSPLSHIEAVGDGNHTVSTLAPTWVHPDDRRRLAAYTARDCLLRNVARYNLRRDVPEARRSKYREYGDISLAVDRLAAGVLGDGWEVRVDGAEDDLDPPDLPDPPEPLGPDADEHEKRIHALLTARYDAEATARIDAWAKALEDQPALRERQNALRDWAEAVRLEEKLPLFERAAAGLGDAVFMLWPQTGALPRLEIIDPAAYFPVLDEHQDADFPDKVHLAWTYKETIDGVEKEFLRRITLELVDIVARKDDPDSGPGSRPVPWSDKPATRCCALSDGSWPMENLGHDPNALDEDRAIWRRLDDGGGEDGTGTVLHRYDLEIDFIPLIHRPGLPDGQSHYGAAITDTAAQIIGDVSESDTDIIAAAAYLRDPTIALSGNREAGERIGPGRIYGTGEGGRMDVLDMSNNHKQLVVHGDRLQDRMWTSLRVPAELVGRVDSTDVASGVTLAYAMSPYGQTVNYSRTVAGPKHALLLKFVQRMGQIAGVFPPGPTPTARVAYGSFLPTDRNEAVTAVTNLLQAGGMSVLTAVNVLADAGLPIDDVAAEVERIFAEDTAGANAIAEAAAGSPDVWALLSDRLGREVRPPGGEPPEVVLPLPPAS